MCVCEISVLNLQLQTCMCNILSQQRASTGGPLSCCLSDAPALLFLITTLLQFMSVMSVLVFNGAEWTSGVVRKLLCSSPLFVFIVLLVVVGECGQHIVYNCCHKLHPSEVYLAWPTKHDII